MTLFRSAWFSGFGGGVVTTVWVGRDDFRSHGYREYGGRAALPIWIDYMSVALEGRPVAPNEPPDGMVKVSVAGHGRVIPGGGGGIPEDGKDEDTGESEERRDGTKGVRTSGDAW